VTVDKLVIITGSSGAVGSALVEEYINDKYFILAIDKKTYPHKLSDKFFKSFKVDLMDFCEDTKYRSSITKEIKKYIPKSLEKFILINNAAYQNLTPFDQISLNDWQKSISINTIAPFFLIQSFSDELKKFSGKVINISSIHAKLTKKNFTCYAASKAALDSITRSLAIELSPYGISINSIAPAAISTDMLQQSFAKNPEKYNQLKECHPANTIASPAEIANFLKAISEHSGKFLTGSILEINGGIGNLLHDPSLQ
jgi:NAD(P)-dependent dehydrogenase (short-subunit alcohol dehydrogenase family)